MVEHMVILQFNAETKMEQKDEAINKLKGLQNKIDGIVDLQAGHNFSERSQGFEIGVTVRFDSKEALEAYGPHPSHQEVVSYLNEIGLSNILVVDFEF